jgi:hypothetical protein
MSTPGDRQGDMVIRRRLGNAAAFASAANWADPSFAIPGWRVLSSDCRQPGLQRERNKPGAR